jgi:hypothetical protein
LRVANFGSLEEAGYKGTSESEIAMAQIHDDPLSPTWGLRVSDVDLGMECIGISSVTRTRFHETRKNFFRNARAGEAG